MGGIVAKGAVHAWHGLTRHEQQVTDCWRDLKLHPDDLNLVREKLQMLHKLFNSKLSSVASEVHKKAGNSVDPNPAVILATVLEHNNKDELLLRDICCVLADIATDLDTADAIRRENLKRVLIDIAGANTDDEFIIADIRRTFALLKVSTTGLGQKLLTDARESKDFNRAYTAMANQPRSATVQLMGLDAIFDLCKDPSTCLKILDCVDGGIKPVLLVLCRYRFNEDIQVRGMQIIGLLAKSSTEVSGLLGRSGTVKVIAQNLNATENFSRRYLQQSIWALNDLGKFRKNIARLEKERIGLVLRRVKRIMFETEDRVEAEARAVIASGGLNAAAEREKSKRRRRSSIAQVRALMDNEQTPEQIQMKLASNKLKKLEQGKHCRLIIPLKLRRLMKASEKAKENEDDLFIESKQESPDEEDEEEKLVVQELDPIESDVELEQVISDNTLRRRQTMPEQERMLDERRAAASKFKH